MPLELHVKSPPVPNAVATDEKLSEIAEMVLTHPIWEASFTKSSWRCSHFVEGGTSEKEIHEMKGRAVPSGGSLMTWA